MDAEAVNQSAMFSNWMSARQDWVITGMHGLNHSYPPEYIRGLDEKNELMKKSYDMLRDFLPKNWSAKAPGNKIDEESIHLLGKLGCRWVFLSDTVVYDTSVNKIFNINRVFSTHSNTSSNDSILNVYELLRKAFTTIGFVNPENINENFSDW